MEAPAAPIVVGEIPYGPVTPGIRASIESSIAATIPPDAKGVALAIKGVQGQYVAFGVAARVGKGWLIGTDIEKEWAGPIAGQVFITKTWK